jgi:hypothetical protein
MCSCYNRYFEVEDNKLFTEYDGQFYRIDDDSYSFCPICGANLSQKGKQQQYSFPEVIKGLRKGKCYIRQGWEASDGISASPVHDQCFISNCVEAAHFSLEDLEATDWIEV